jgi:type I restriction enzyme, S subunit
VRDHFHLLHDTPDAIPKLRQAILQLAVQGRLVPQNPKDEPASILLAETKSLFQRLVTQGKLRKPEPLPPVQAENQSFLLPDKWEWCRLGELIRISSGDGLTADKMNKAGKIPVYGGNGINGYHDKWNVEKPTLVIGRVGFYCGSVHETPNRAWVTDNAFVTTFAEDHVDRRFLYWLLKGTDLAKNDNATAQPVISGTKVYPIVIGLPPLAEQKLIVARVEELLRWCDSLEAQLHQSRTLGAHFLESTLHHLLAA